MLKPMALKPGDKIGILSTARSISRKELEFADQLFRNWELIPVYGNSIDAQFNQFAGDDTLRAADFQVFLNDPDIKAIICARGGYGTIRIIDHIDFTAFMQNPKFICGYSDITLLHTHINDKLGIASIHSTMPFSFERNTEEAIQSLKDALFGNAQAINADAHQLNKIGEAEGILIGGNLSILYSLLGTKFGFSTGNKILFIEDIDEYLYHIDRMMMSLKLAGKLDFVSGIIVGGMTDMKDNKVKFGITAEEIIASHLKPYNIPVCYNFPAGHIDDNRALILGNKVKLTITKSTTALTYI
jgi:muramoyltetrapeptide carboxypeptidase